MSSTSRQTTASRFAVSPPRRRTRSERRTLLLALFAGSPAYGRLRALDAAIEIPLSIGHVMLVFERRISEFEEKILFAAHTFEIVEEAHARLSARPEPRRGERSRSTGRGVINRQA